MEGNIETVSARPEASEIGAAAAAGEGPGLLTEEEVICIGTESADFEDFYQVIELAVDVADDSDGGLDVNNVALAHQKLFGLGAYCLND